MSDLLPFSASLNVSCDQSLVVQTCLAPFTKLASPQLPTLPPVLPNLDNSIHDRAIRKAI